MSRNNLKIYLIIIAGMLTGGLVYAAELTPPKLPVLYYGTASVNGAATTTSPTITMRLKSSGLEIASTTAATNGRYFIEMPCANYPDQAMIFKIGNLIAAEATCVDASAVPSVNLNLNFNSADQTVENSTANINIPSSISDNAEVKINFTATSTLAGKTILTLGASGLVLNRESAVAANKFIVTFAPNTIISGGISWDGALIAPTLSNISLSIPAEPSYFSQTEKIISLGYGGGSLTFDQPASILFPGQTGRQIGFSRTGSDFTEITAVCPDNSANSLLATTAQECKFNGATDLTVWTKHFTYYAVYKQVYVPPPSRGGASFAMPEIKPVIATTTVAATTTPIAASTPAAKPAIKPQILPQILGVKYYADGSLIRGKDKKIYLIDQGKLVVIRTLAQLKKYAGQKIYDETDEVIRQYMKFFDGQLIRGSRKKIYVIIKGKKQPIFTLAELRQKYKGQKIYDVSDKILGLY